MSKARIRPWMLALLVAILIHIVIFLVSNDQKWLAIMQKSQPNKKDIQVTLLESPEKPTVRSKAQPNTASKQVGDASKSTNDLAIPKTTETSKSSFFQSAPQTEKNNNNDAFSTPSSTGQESANEEQNSSSIQSDSGTTIRNGISVPAGNRTGLNSSLLDQSENNPVTEKPELLDLSKIPLSPDANEKETSKIFSKELQKKIAESKAAQKEYAKGAKKPAGSHYPITEDADGTKYVNIKGVCWRMPKEDATDSSQKGWAIVFDGCGIKSKMFHFELNISPSILTNELLGPDSPFNLEQQPK